MHGDYYFKDSRDAPEEEAASVSVASHTQNVTDLDTLDKEHGNPKEKKVPLILRKEIAMKLAMAR